MAGAKRGMKVQAFWIIQKNEARHEALAGVEDGNTTVVRDGIRLI